MRLPSNSRVTVPFGATGDDYLGDSRVHTGTDYSWFPSRKVRAPEGGKITAATYYDEGGNYIKMKSGDREYYFGHLSKFKVKVGQKVKEGQVIGIMGDTGLAIGVHLHFQMWLDGKLIDGDKYIRNEMIKDLKKRIAKKNRIIKRTRKQVRRLREKLILAPSRKDLEEARKYAEDLEKQLAEAEAESEKEKEEVVQSIWEKIKEIFNVN